MFRIQAKLIKKQANSWLLLPEEKKSCPRCESQGGCASMQLVQAFRFKQHFLKVPKPENINAEEGDDIWLCIDRHQLNKSAILFYGVPLCALLFGAILGAFWGDIYAIVLSLFCMLLAYGAQSFFNQKLPKFELQPMIHDFEKSSKEVNVCQSEQSENSL